MAKLDIPLFSYVWGWFWAFFTIYQGFMSQFQGQKVYGAWAKGAGTSNTYMQFEKTRLWFTGRHAVQGMFMLMAMVKPMGPGRGKGCRYLAVAAYFLVCVTQFCDACSAWWFLGNIP